VSLRLDLDAIWTPKPTQAAFLAAIDAAPRFAIPAYVGAFGSGKSWAVCRAALGLAFAYPGIQGLIGRFNATDLRDTTQATFFELVQDIETSVRAQLPDGAKSSFAGIGTYQKSTGDYLVCNGSVIKFRPLEEAERKYKSLTLGFWGMDEASEVAEASALMLQGRLRQMGTPCVGFIVSNPTGYDHWLYRWYVKAPKGYPLFRTNTYENLDHLPPGYVEELRKSYPPDHIRRYLEGQWGGLEDGAPIFPRFDAATHVRPLDWVRRRPIQVGIDLGYQEPGVVWAQLDPVEERLRVLKTWSPRELATPKLAEGIRARNETWFPAGTFQYFCGHDGNARKDTNERSSAEILAEYGMRPHLRFTATERGFSIIRAMLDPRDDGTPGLLLDTGLATLIEGFQGGYRYAKPKRDGDRKDEPEKNGLYDPLMDALRYIVVHTFTTAGTLPRLAPVPAFRGLTAARRPSWFAEQRRRHSA